MAKKETSITIGGIYSGISYIPPVVMFYSNTISPRASSAVSVQAERLKKLLKT